MKHKLLTAALVLLYTSPATVVAVFHFRPFIYALTILWLVLGTYTALCYGKAWLRSEPSVSRAH